jgi:hypothetical protein
MTSSGFGAACSRHTSSSWVWSEVAATTAGQRDLRTDTQLDRWYIVKKPDVRGAFPTCFLRNARTAAGCYARCQKSTQKSIAHLKVTKADGSGRSRAAARALFSRLCASSNQPSCHCSSSTVWAPLP